MWWLIGSLSRMASGHGCLTLSKLPYGSVVAMQLRTLLVASRSRFQSNMLVRSVDSRLANWNPACSRSTLPLVLAQSVRASGQSSKSMSTWSFPTEKRRCGKGPWCLGTPSHRSTIRKCWNNSASRLALTWIRHLISCHASNSE